MGWRSRPRARTHRRPGRPPERLVAVLLVSALQVGCWSPASDPSAEQVVSAFLEQMSHPNWTQARARAAYELIWREGREQLQERARLASALQARTVGPEEMLAPAHFAMRFEPSRSETRVEGRWATVTLLGSHPTTERAVVRCVREPEGWRVMVQIPAPQEIRKRPETPSGAP